MAVAPTEIRTLARSYTKAAIKTLVGIMRQPKAPPAARVMAANALLDRGWGKAAQLVAEKIYRDAAANRSRAATGNDRPAAPE